MSTDHAGPVPARASSSAAQNRHARVAVVAPLGVLFVAVIISVVIAVAVDPAATGTSFSTGFVPFAAVFFGGMLTLGMLIQSAVEQFPADRARTAPWPITFAVTTGALTISSTSFGPSAATSPMLPISLAIGLALGGITYVVATHTQPTHELPTSARRAPQHAIRRGLPAQHTAIWSGRVPLPPARLLGWIIFPMAFGLVLPAALVSQGLLLTNFLPFLITTLIPGSQFAAQRVRVTIGPSGLIIRNGLTRRSAYSIALEHIDSAWITDAPKADLTTGYGKRSTAARLAFLSRPGPALLVRLTDGTDVVVAVDRPERPAGILNDLLDRRPLSAQPAAREQ